MIHTDTGYYTLIVPPPGAGSSSYTHIWYLKDHLGNNRVLADGNGNAVAVHDYDPYGEEIAVATGDLYPLPPGGTDSPYKYGGKEWNATTSTYDFEARYLSPSFHRFTTMDPLCEKYYSVSPYAYCADNPIRFVDPLGLWHWDADGNLIWDEFDNIETLSSFLNISFENACKIIYRNTPTFKVLNRGYIIRSYNIWTEEKESTTHTVNNTLEAWSHYRKGNGEIADVGDETTEALVSSNTFLGKLKKITSQKVQQNGSFSVDLTSKVFHIGKTNVHYTTVNFSTNCTINP